MRAAGPFDAPHMAQGCGGARRRLWIRRRCAPSPAGSSNLLPEILPAVFGRRPREVLFDAYFAVFAKPSSSSTRAAP